VLRRLTYAVGLPGLVTQASFRAKDLGGTHRAALASVIGHDVAATGALEDSVEGL
jgi:hypothetical protein